MNYFVTAISTDSGKTLVSAILCEALQADYWKPVQAGFPRDTDRVKALVSNQKTFFHPETYLLRTGVSPHASAKLDQTSIRLDDLRLPKTKNTLVIEGAGGCLVPLNDEDLMIDLMALSQAEIIVVSNHYLGSINHTLLTLESLQKRKLPVKGIIFNGEPNEETERIILHRTRHRLLLRVRHEATINKEAVQKYAAALNANWHG